MDGRLEARLDDVQSERQFRRLRVIRFTQHTTLLFAAPAHRPAEIETIPAWSHSLNIKLRRDDTHLIAALFGNALDPDHGPIFERMTIPANDLLRLLQVAANCPSDERFETLIFEVFELASRRSMDENRRGSPLRMQRLKRFIEQESHNDLSLERMSQVAGLTTFACLRQFREATGTTPHAYVLECRIQKARGLLCADGSSIAAVARATGFSDQAYFARIFKKSTGLTPMEYRRTSNEFG